MDEYNIDDQLDKPIKVEIVDPLLIPKAIAALIIGPVLFWLFVKIGWHVFDVLGMTRR